MKRKFLFLVLLVLALPFAVGAQAVPMVSSYTINGQGADVKLNPNGGSVEIQLEINKPVKFNTVSICDIGDTTCNRNTAVKYFTQTSSYSTNFLRNWDGAVSGGGVAPDGNYKLKATIKDEDENQVSLELITPLLVVDSTSPIQVLDEPGEAGSGSDNSATTLSAHDAPSNLSPAAPKPSKPLTIDPGRDRLVSVGAPVKFRAKLSNTGSTERVRVEWSFGDGSAKRGEVATHAYQFPGSYVVVANAYQGGEQAVGRTKVEVVEPKVELGEVVFSPKPYAELINRSGGELNLGHWQLQVGEDLIRLPSDTIIVAGGRLRLPLDERLARVTATPAVTLLYPDSRPVASPPASRTLAAAETLPRELPLLAAQLAEARARLVALRRPPAVSVGAEPAAVVTPIEAEEGERVKELSADQPSEVVVIRPTARTGWWGKMWRSLSGALQ